MHTRLITVAALAVATLSTTPTLAQKQPSAAETAAVTMFTTGVSAMQAAREMRVTHRLPIAGAVTALLGGGYPATAVASSVRAEYSATATPVYDAFVSAGHSTRTLPTTLTQAGITLDCWSDQGLPVPCGTFGGLFDAAPLGQVTWTPQKTGYVDSVLTITASALPPLDVRIGSLTLDEVSYSAAQIKVRLPSTPTTGPLSLRRKSDRVEGRLESMYQVTKPVVIFSWPAVIAGAITGASRDAAAWMAGARLTGCTVVGALASAPAGSFSSAATFQGNILNEITEAGGSAALGAAVQDVLRSAWTEWAASVSVPHLPWYPSFQVWKSATAPPTPNVPMSLGTLASNALLVMAPPTLATRIETMLYGASTVPDDAKAAILEIATLFSARFALMLASTQVTSVFASGSVTAVANGSATMGAVEGTCSGTGVLGTSPTF
jgi:hypothetical protein